MSLAGSSLFRRWNASISWGVRRVATFFQAVWVKAHCTAFSISSASCSAGSGSRPGCSSMGMPVRPCSRLLDLRRRSTAALRDLVAPGAEAPLLAGIGVELLDDVGAGLAHRVIDQAGRHAH